MIVPRFTIHQELLWGTKCFHTLCYFNFVIFIVDDISNIHVGSYARRKKMYSLKTGDGSSTSFEDEDDSPEDHVNGSFDNSTISSLSLINLNNSNSLSFLDVSLVYFIIIYCSILLFKSGRL